MDNSPLSTHPARAKGPIFRTWLGPEYPTTRVRSFGRQGSDLSDPYKPRRNHEESRPGIDITKTVASPSDSGPVDNFQIDRGFNRTGYAQCSEVAA